MAAAVAPVGELLADAADTQVKYERLTSLDDRKKKGQFFTPPQVCQLMASFFHFTKSDAFRLLDPGAGVGAYGPYTAEDVARSSCYVMPIMLEQDGLQAQVSARLREAGIQTSIFYPSIHKFTAYRERFPDISLPVTELASRTELTLPFYPHMSNADQDRVARALTEVIGA